MRRRALFILILALGACNPLGFICGDPHEWRNVEFYPQRNGVKADLYRCGNLTTTFVFEPGTPPPQPPTAAEVHEALEGWYKEHFDKPCGCT